MLSLIKEFWRVFVKGYRQLRMASLACGMCVAIALLEGINISLLVPLLETLQTSELEKPHWISELVTSVFNALNIPFKLWTILGILVGLLLVITWLKYLKMILTARLRTGFIVWLRSQFMSTLINADKSYFNGQRLGVMTDNLTFQTHHAGTSVVDIIELLSSLVLVLAYLIAAFFISPTLTIVAFAMAAVVTLLMQTLVTKARILSEDHVKRNNDYQVEAVESLSGIDVIKMFLLERIRGRQFEGKAEEVGVIEFLLAKNHARMVVSQEFVLFSLIGGIVYIGVTLLDLNIATIIALLFVLYRLMPKVVALNSLRQSFAESITKVHAVSEAMQSPANKAINSGSVHFTRLESAISFNSVGFSYNEHANVLRDIQFDIRKGEMTAIVGASGTGKSTIIDLLLRHYDPDGGYISVDNRTLKELDLKSWRTAIGLVSQDIYLFNGTVSYNIGLDRPGVTFDQIRYSASQAYADEFITALPAGYETNIGDRGWNLSGGQRQRIALARAILKSPSILILDEATSALDSESERLIQRYIESIRGDSTILVIAHRTSTIRYADQIIVLENGRVVETGNWDSLMKLSGVFARYQHIQSVGS